MAKREKPMMMRLFEANDPQGKTGAMKTIRADGVKDAGKRHDRLPPDLEERADAMFPVVGKVFGHTKQSWRDGFCKDLHPEREIGVWEHILHVADQLWQDDPKALKKLDRQRLLKLVVAVSSGVVDIPSQLQGVNDEQVALVRSAYQGK